MKFLTVYIINNNTTLVLGDGFAPAPNGGKQLPEPMGTKISDGHPMAQLGHDALYPTL